MSYTFARQLVIYTVMPLRKIFKILARFSAIAVAMSFAYLVYWFGHGVDGISFSIISFIVLSMICFVPQVGLWLTTTPYGAKHRILTSALMVPSTLVLFYSLVEEIQIFFKSGSVNRPVALVVDCLLITIYIWAFKILHAEHKNLHQEGHNN